MNSEVIQMIQNVIGGSVGTLLVLTCLYMFRNFFSSWLLTNANLDLESFKAELGETAEHLKFDLQKDVARSQLYSNSIFDIYPDLFSKVRLAHGIVANFYGFRYAATWTGFNIVDFEKVLSEKNVASGTRGTLLAAIQANRAAGIKKLEEFLRDAEFSDAQNRLHEIMNAVMLKEIFITSEIRDLTLDIHRLLVSAKVDADIARQDPTNMKWITNLRKTLTDVEPKIETLRTLISRELNPPSRKVVISTS